MDEIAGQPGGEDPAPKLGDKWGDDITPEAQGVAGGTGYRRGSTARSGGRL